ncbi:MAG: DUF1588 domain-containing protein [Myxococcales bacterium]|nr:DUF1588 domain-containing protein [Myxococcales bacterium]
MLEKRYGRAGCWVGVWICVLGCTGRIGDGRAGDPTPRDGAAGHGRADGTGDPGESDEPDTDTHSNDPENQASDCVGEPLLLAPQTRRLTARQYRNTLEAVFGPIFETSDMPTFEDDYPTIGLANDPNKLGITTISVDSVYNSARTVSARVAAEYEPVAACLGDTGSQCFGELVDSLGMGLWRRPVQADERSELLDAVDAVERETATRRERMDLLLQALIMSPNTLFRLEVGQEADQRRALDGYELASLLSYTLWDSPPDAELLQLAESGRLHDPEELSQQAERLVEDPRFVSSLEAFFSDFLKLDSIHTVAKADRFGLTPQARQALHDSAHATIRARLSSLEADLMSVFAGQQFQMDTRSAPFFGVSDASLSEMAPVDADAEQREGMLSHPAFLAVHAGEGSTGIVKRGVFILEQLLGYDIPDPPDNVDGVDAADLPDFDPDTTSTRELLGLTHTRQPRCTSCHNIIDPAGFGLENYDPVGAFRTTEKGGVPIDASGELTIGSEHFAFDTGIEYLRQLGESERLRRSVLANYFAYAMGQAGDGCEVRRFDDAVRDSGNRFRDLAEHIVATESFLSRSAR